MTTLLIYIMASMLISVPFTMAVTMPVMEWLFRGEMSVTTRLKYKVQLIFIVTLIAIILITIITNLERNL